MGAAGNFKTLIKALEITNLESELKQYKEVTLLAPTDEAFAKLPAARLDQLLRSPEKLKRLLLQHVVPGRLMPERLPARGDVKAHTPFKNAAGRRVNLFCEADSARLQPADASVVACGIRTSGGLIHIIDTVLVPAEE